MGIKGKVKQPDLSLNTVTKFNVLNYSATYQSMAQNPEIGDFYVCAWHRTLIESQLVKYKELYCAEMSWNNL